MSFFALFRLPCPSRRPFRWMVRTRVQPDAPWTALAWRGVSMSTGVTFWRSARSAGRRSWGSEEMSAIHEPSLHSPPPAGGE